MRVFYRVCPTLSDKPPAVSWDKYTMIKKCYDSFLAAGGDTCEIYIFNDSLPQKWIDELFPYYKKIIDTGGGKDGTLLHAEEYASKHSGKVLLLEDDYYWRPNTLPLLEKALDYLPFVSPYDHFSHYLEDKFDKLFELRLIGNVVYRDSPSNTHTFGTTGEKLVEHFEILEKYKTLDHEMFTEIAYTGDKIWNPVYSFATHLVSGLLAPNVDWQGIW